MFGKRDMLHFSLLPHEDDSILNPNRRSTTTPFIRALPNNLKRLLHARRAVWGINITLCGRVDRKWPAVYAAETLSWLQESRPQTKSYELKSEARLVCLMEGRRSRRLTRTRPTHCISEVCVPRPLHLSHKNVPLIYVFHVSVGRDSQELCK